MGECGRGLLEFGGKSEPKLYAMKRRATLPLIGGGSLGVNDAPSLPSRLSPCASLLWVAVETLEPHRDSAGRLYYDLATGMPNPDR